MRAVVVGGGDPPAPELLDWLLAVEGAFLVAADGGADSLRASGRVPRYLIGDFDSVLDTTLEWYRAQPGCHVRHMPRQSDTDIEKCLDVLVHEGVRTAALCAVFGNRLDHSLSNLAIVLRWSERIRLTVYAGQSVLEVVRGNCVFPASLGTVVSLYAFDPAVRVTTRGLKYPLHDEPLVFGVRESTSNAASARHVHLQVRGGPLFLVRSQDEVMRQGLLYAVAENRG